MKPVDTKDNTYIDFKKEANDKNPKFKNGEFQNKNIIFAKGYSSIWLEEVLMIEKVKNTFPWTYVLSDFNGEEIIEIFYKKELLTTNQ